MNVGQVISRKSTRLYKLAIWASAVGMVVLVTAINSQRNGHPMAATDVIPGIITGRFLDLLSEEIAGSYSGR